MFCIIVLPHLWLCVCTWTSKCKVIYICSPWKLWAVEWPFDPGMRFIAWPEVLPATCCMRSITEGELKRALTTETRTIHFITDYLPVITIRDGPIKEGMANCFSKKANHKFKGLLSNQANHKFHEWGSTCWSRKMMNTNSIPSAEYRFISLL